MKFPTMVAFLALCILVVSHSAFAQWQCPFDYRCGKREVCSRKLFTTSALKKKKNLNHALFDRYRARMLQEGRLFNLVNVLVMRRHHDLKYLTQLKILSTIENRFLYHWTGKVSFPTGNNLLKKM